MILRSTLYYQRGPLTGRSCPRAVASAWEYRLGRLALCWGILRFPRVRHLAVRFKTTDSFHPGCRASVTVQLRRLVLGLRWYSQPPPPWASLEPVFADTPRITHQF